jgi:predicted ferric reductase
VVARFLLVPYWDEEEVYVRLVAENPGRSDLGASLVIVGALMLIPAALTLARLFATRSPRLSQAGSALVTIGSVGAACISMAALVAGQMVRLGDDEASIALWDRVWNTHKLWPIMTVHLGAIGFILIAVGLYRARVVPRGAAILVGIGGATMMTTSAGPIRPLLITAASLALVGFTWVALATTISDDQRRERSHAKSAA